MVKEGNKTFGTVSFNRELACVQPQREWVHTQAVEFHLLKFNQRLLALLIFPLYFRKRTNFKHQNAIIHF